MTPSMIELMAGIRDGLFSIQMFFIQMYRPSERGVKNELEVHCVVAVLPLKCSHQLEPSGSPISDSALRGQYMMFKQESGVCVCVDPT